MALHSADGCILTFLPDIRWACGFTGSNGLLIVGTEEAHFVTDGRYTAQAVEEVVGAQVHIAPRHLAAYAAQHRLGDGIRTCIVQGDHLTLEAYRQLDEALEPIEWVPVSGLLEQDVARKASFEIDAIRQAQAITDAVFAHVLDIIRPGVSEREVAAEIVYEHMRRGAVRMSFDPIVASGPQSALPHAQPTARTLEAGDMVVLDFGCFVDGYASDMTRTVALGNPTDEARKVHRVVLDAQKRALDAARAGISGRDLDAVARNAITEAGYGEAFVHSLGHGVGLQIHEWPSISQRTEDALPPDAVVTIEPGIYLPGRFGVRIEDLIVLNDDGAENLTRSPRELICL